MFFDHVPQHGLICAHRGARSIAPENTELAMTRARECGAHCWETDVRMSRDGELVIIHDATLGRTTDVATHQRFRERGDYRVDRFTVRELRELDAGAWFLNDDPFATVDSGEVSDRERAAIQGQQVPLLREVLNYSKIHSFPVNLEMKPLDTSPGNVAVVDRVIEMLRETETMDLVLLSSFRHDYLQRARALSPGVGIAVLAEDRHPPNLIQYLKGLSAVAYHPDIAICDTELIVHLQQSGFRVNSWTINEMSQAEEMFQIGAGVITDWPQRISG